MVVISYSGKEANGKIVYYGPGLGGKTTNLEFIYDSVPASSRGKMVSMKTQTDRTLFFDFLPLDLGELGGFKTRFLLYTVPGQVFYNATRKLVLRGADAIAFIADSQRGKMEENKESLANLEENLADYDLSLDDIPWVIQYNKRDLPDIYTVEELNKELNTRNVPFYEAVATEGTGVFETFRGLSKLLLEKLSGEIGQRMVMGRNFGQKPQEEPQEPVQSPEAEPKAAAESPLEVESLEVAASTTQPVESDEVSGERTEWNSEEALSAEEEPAIAENWESSSESEIEARPWKDSEESAEEPEPAGPAIVHKEEEVGSFFSEIASAPPLDDIRQEEVVLSETWDRQAEGEDATADEQDTGKQEEEPSSGTEEWAQDVSIEEARQHEQQGKDEEPVREEEVLQEEQGAQEETIREEDVVQEEAILEEEPSFIGIIKRNNVGVFEAQEPAGHERSISVPEESVCAEPGRQFEIEVPVEMAPEDEEKEIVVTLKLKLKRGSREREKQSDEFLLDGISR